MWTPQASIQWLLAPCSATPSGGLGTEPAEVEGFEQVLKELLEADSGAAAVAGAIGLTALPVFGAQWSGTGTSPLPAVADAATTVENACCFTAPFPCTTAGDIRITLAGAETAQHSMHALGLERQAHTEGVSVLGGDWAAAQGAFDAVPAQGMLVSTGGTVGTRPAFSARQGELPAVSSDLSLPSSEPTPSPPTEPQRTEASENRPFWEATSYEQPRNDSPPWQRASAVSDTLHAVAPAAHPVHSTANSEALGGASLSHIATPNGHTVEQVARYIEQMVYERERESLRVRLDPPELGVIELRVQASGSEVQAWLSAERELTRQLLQQAQHYLREQLESRGLHLTHFDVGRQSGFEGTQGRPSGFPAPSGNANSTPTATDSLVHDGRWSVWV